MVQELRDLLNEVSKLSPDQKSSYQWWLTIQLVRDLAYYVVAGIVAFALGRRIVQAILTATRESRRGSA
jgi:hypothetical protein